MPIKLCLKKSKIVSKLSQQLRIDRKKRCCSQKRRHVNKSQKNCTVKCWQKLSKKVNFKSTIKAIDEYFF